jgi:hypothetical protein
MRLSTGAIKVLRQEGEELTELSSVALDVGRISNAARDMGRTL